MKKTLLSALLVLSTSAFAADETKMLPILDADYCPAPTVALMGGFTKYSDNGDHDALYGIELGFACPVFQIKDLEINQVLSLTHYSENGFDINTLEMNPRVMFKLSDKIKVGAGPGLAVLFTDADTEYGFNLGASINYDITPDYFIGLEMRYQWATESAYDNGRTLFKVGTHF